MAVNVLNSTATTQLIRSKTANTVTPKHWLVYDRRPFLVSIFFEFFKSNISINFFVFEH